MCKDDSGSALLRGFEGMLGADQVRRFRVRFEEGYDVPGDSAYDAWKVLFEGAGSAASVGQASSSSSCASSEVLTLPVQPPLPTTCPGSTSTSTSSTSVPQSLDTILVYPQVQLPPKKKAGRGSGSYPRCLSSSKGRSMLKEQQEKKMKEQQEKERRKLEREEKKKKKEEERMEQERKRQEKKQKKIKEQQQKEARKKQTKQKKRPAASTSTSTSSQKPYGTRDRPDQASACSECRMFKKEQDGIDDWVICVRCQSLYHFTCTDLVEQDEPNSDNLEWICPNCIH